VRPLWVHFFGADGNSWLRMPPDVRELMMTAMARMADDNPAAARAALEQARQLTPERRGAEHADNLAILERLGMLEEFQEDFAAALDHYRTGLAIAEKAPAATSQWRARLLSREAGTLLKQNDIDGALAVAQRAQAASAGDAASIVAAGNNIGVLLARKGDLAGARRAYENAYGELRSAPARRPLSTPTVAADIDLDAQMDQLLEAGLAQAGSSGLAWLAPKLLSNLGLARWQQGEARLEGQRERRAQLLPRVQAQLPDGAVLLEMLMLRPLELRPAAETRSAPARYATRLIRRDGEPLYLDLGEAETIDRLIIELRKALSYPHSADEVRALGRELDERLMAPVRKAAGNATTFLPRPKAT
jgi:hypothetical protein